MDTVLTQHLHGSGERDGRRTAIIASLDAGRPQPHALQGQGADWPEKNCYADLWVGVLAALELEPLAMLGHTVAVDFLGDQWTFFKPSHPELRELYGIDVQEMTVWRPLEEHVLEHAPARRFVCTEVDSFWLPDTEATDYRAKHTKTTILINSIDPAQRRLGYFHNGGYFQLEGEDYDGALRAGRPAGPDEMPLFAELVSIDRRIRREPQDLAQRALRLLWWHYTWRPSTNPFTRFAERLERDLPSLRSGGLQHYHAWAFAVVRQAGAAFELAAAHLHWLATLTSASFEPAAQRLREISSMNKSLILKGARAVVTGKDLYVHDAALPMARAWDEGMQMLGEALVASGAAQRGHSTTPKEA
jgi:hypothetical protein